MKNKMLLMVVFAAISLVSCTTEKENFATKINKETIEIGSGEIIKDNSYLGYIEPIEQSSIGGKIGGRIVQISVDKGDRVKAGQILAIIDGQESKETLSSALNVLGWTQNMYGSTDALFDAQIATTKDKVNQAKKNVELAKENLAAGETWVGDTRQWIEEQLKTAQKQIEQATLAAETAEAQYENTKLLLNQKESDVYTNGRNTINQADILARNTLDFIDTIFGVSEKNRSKNDAFETYLGAKSNGSKNTTEWLWRESHRLYQDWKVQVDILSGLDLNVDENRAKVVNILRESQDFYEKLRTLAQSAYDTIDSSIAAQDFPETTITDLKKQTTDVRSSLEQMLISVNGNYVVGIKWAMQNIDTVKNEKSLQLSLLDKQLSLARNQVDIAKQSYVQYQTTSTGTMNQVSSKRDIATKQVEIAEEQYAESVSGLSALEKQKSAQLATLKTQIAQIQGNADMAKIAVSNNVIIAPFDGVIVEKFASVWQVIGVGFPVFSLAKDDRVKIKVLVGESGMDGIKIGEMAKIELPNTHEFLSGSISMIEPYADTLSKKIPVQIQMDNTQGKVVLWMYTNVYFGWEKIQGKVIPYRFVEYSYGKSRLNVLKENGEVLKIEIGLRACTNDLCVIDGNISEWTKVITP